MKYSGNVSENILQLKNFTEVKTGDILLAVYMRVIEISVSSFIAFDNKRIVLSYYSVFYLSYIAHTIFMIDATQSD